jgi:2-amino-4-hydroxy-6-hydroxymethyldihydropteridine diphosphokinase
MVKCYIGIGSNLGNRRQYISKAIEELKKTRGVAFKKSSTIYETEPLGGIEQGKFLNGVLEIETSLQPRVLLKELNRIEDNLGRIRILKNGPRTIDLDILYYGDKSLAEEGLVIPHPEIDTREFVLKGLRELGKISRK